MEDLSTCNICIVTVCRNPGLSILDTAASIAAQTHALRWIVIDGISHDGTQERLRALPRPPDSLISEPDQGIADAFNKGLLAAGNHDVLFLNAGDALIGTTHLEQLARTWDRTAYPWIIGHILVTTPVGSRLVKRGPPAAVAPLRLVDRGNLIPHPAVLAPASLLLEQGGFDITLKYAMDYDLWARLIVRGFTPQISDIVITSFPLGGRSSNVSARVGEDMFVRRRNGVSAGFVAECWLNIGGVARLVAAPLRDSAWAYRLNRWIGW